MENKEILISVVMASYNHDKYVKEAIQSILNQTFQNFEIIITDDGSEDNTVKKIEEINSNKIKLFTFEQNHGACTALNNSIMNSKGSYIAVINSDDVWHENKLEFQINFLDENPEIDAVFTWATFYDENLQPFKKNQEPYFKDIFKQKNLSSAQWLKKFFFEGNSLCHPSILIKKHCYDVLGLYNNRFRQLPDFDMWIKFCKKFSFHIIPKELVKFRLLQQNKNASSPSLVNQVRGRNELHLIMKNFFNEITESSFKEGFAQNIRNLDFKSEEEFEIEKAFMYLNTDTHGILTIEKIYEMLEKKNTQVLLETKYRFTDKDFLKLTSEVNALSPTLTNSTLFNLLVNRIIYTPKIKILKFVYNVMLNHVIEMFKKNR